ncbi:hypothetical protein V6Z11_A12G072200 [Gossypium hirsutum]
MRKILLSRFGTFVFSFLLYHHFLSFSSLLTMFLLQKKASDTVKHITMETIQELYYEVTPKSLGIADLGCSSGPNSLSLIKDMVEAVEGTSHKIFHPMPEFRVYLNDLPTNDFNSVFKSLPDFYKDLKKDRNQEGPSIFIAGYPGSFYGRLFPCNCLHFIYSSYSLHWLSKVPPALYDEHGKSINKGNVYISESSPPSVSQAYYKQFQEDFSLFLKSRSEELVTGGRMVLILLGRIGQDHVDRGNSFFWEILSRSLAISVSQVLLVFHTCINISFLLVDIFSPLCFAGRD